jgi:hypothetical protein
MITAETKAKIAAASSEGARKHHLRVKLLAYASLGHSAKEIAEIIGKPEPGVTEELKGLYVGHMEFIWDLVSKPLKFPGRRRRSDREVPKAA